jgi:cytosine deaminase
MVAHVRSTLLAHATLQDGRVRDVLIVGERIEAIGDGLEAPPGTDVVDLAGRLLLLAAVEPHAHLDKAFLAERIVNPTGDLYGAIEAMEANRDLVSVPDIVARGERAARLMAANGYTAVRTHADTTREIGLRSVEALVEVRRRVADAIDVEIVALCGWPVTGREGADHRALLADAIALGADLVGGCPHLEPYAGDGDIDAATDVFLQIASDRRRGLDLHTDETLDPSADGLDVLARRVLAGFDLPVTASHCVSLSMQPEAQQRATAERVAAAGISVVALPHTNLFLQGRGHVLMPRGLTAVAMLRAAGVNVAAGADNLQDPFNPVGRACPFETAGLMVMTSHLSPGEAWDSVSAAPARALGRAAELAPGAPANLLAVPAATVREAIAFGPGDRAVWRRGVRLG